MSLLGNRHAPLNGEKKWGLVAAAGLGGLIACQDIIDPNSALGPLASVELFSYGMAKRVSTHVGPYATVLSSIAICFAALFLSRPVAVEAVAA